MSKIVRANADVKAFASAATGTERTVFGEVTQSDLLTDQLSVDYLRGFGIVGANENPTREDFNALGFTSMQFIAYLHQMGVAEWNALQQYQIGSQANRAGVLYACKTVDHISATAPESDATNWRQVNLGVSGDGGNLTQTLPQLQAIVNRDVGVGVSGTGGDLTQTLAQTQAILDNAALKTNNGLAGNYEVVLDFGSYTSGTFTYPNSHVQSDYDCLVIAFDSSSATARQSGASGLLTKEHIATHPSDWEVLIQSDRRYVYVQHASTSSFLIGAPTAISEQSCVTQIIGYLKEGVS